VNEAYEIEEPMRKIILNLAMSLDGYIVDEEGGYAWIIGDEDKHLDTDANFDFPAFIENIDTVVMGRKPMKILTPTTIRQKRSLSRHRKPSKLYDSSLFFC
jgi:dihydrofolate reductase